MMLKKKNLTGYLGKHLCGRNNLAFFGGGDFGRSNKLVYLL